MPAWVCQSSFLHMNVSWCYRTIPQHASSNRSLGKVHAQLELFTWLIFFFLFMCTIVKIFHVFCFHDFIQAKHECRRNFLTINFSQTTCYHVIIIIITFSKSEVRFIVCCQGTIYLPVLLQENTICWWIKTRKEAKQKDWFLQSRF